MPMLYRAQMLRLTQIDTALSFMASKAWYSVKLYTKVA